MDKTISHGILESGIKIKRVLEIKIQYQLKKSKWDQEKNESMNKKLGNERIQIVGKIYR